MPLNKERRLFLEPASGGHVSLRPYTHDLVIHVDRDMPGGLIYEDKNPASGRIYCVRLETGDVAQRLESRVDGALIVAPNPNESTKNSNRYSGNVKTRK
jgi:hypothetical protein